jgi:hypothetical protein
MLFLEVQENMYLEEEKNTKNRLFQKNIKP